MPRFLLLVLILVAGATLAAGVYKWTDEHGRTIYSDSPPPGKAGRPVDLPRDAPKEQLEQARQALAQQQLRERTQEVTGTAALAFVRADGASLPEPPIGLTVVLRSLADQSEIKVAVSDPAPDWQTIADGGSSGVSSHQNFALSLRPGRYRILGFDVSAPALSDTRFFLPTAGPQFSVPEGSCVHVGRLAFVLLRLPPMSHDQALAVVTAMSKAGERGLFLVYLPKGSLVSLALKIDTPAQTDWRDGLPGGWRALERARARGCELRPGTL